MNGCRHKFFVFYFSLQHLNFLHGKFHDYGTSHSSFWAKNAKYVYMFHLKKYLWQNIGSFSPFQKEITNFC